jgi:hypothetical protein
VFKNFLPVGLASVARHAAPAGGGGGGDCFEPPRHCTASTSSSDEPELSAQRYFEALEEEAPSIVVCTAMVCALRCGRRC